MLKVVGAQAASVNQQLALLGPPRTELVWL